MSNVVRSPVGDWFNKRTNELHRRFANNGKRYDLVDLTIYTGTTVVMFRNTHLMNGNDQHRLMVWLLF